MKKNKTFLLILAALVAAGLIGLILNIFKVPVGQTIAMAIGLFVLALPFVLKKPQIGLFLVGFFLPFERMPTVELGGLTVKINHILIIFLALAFIGQKIAQGKLRLPQDPGRFFLLLFLLTLTFSLPAAINLTRSLEVLAFMILMGITYLTVTLVVEDKESLILAIKGILWGAVVAALLGLFQFFGDMINLPTQVTLLKEGYDKSTFGFARVMAASQEPLYFSNYIFIPFFVGLLLLIRGQMHEVFKKSWAILLVLALLINLVLAISRGAYLAFAITFVIFVILQVKIIFQPKVLAGAVMVVVVVLLGSYLALLKSEPQAIDEFVSHVKVEDRDVGESVVSRVNASRQALDLFGDKPIFGIGLGNFGPQVQGNIDEEPDTGWFIVNNEYLELLAENGIVGLASFALLIIVLFIRAIIAFFKTQDKLLKSAIAGLSLALVAILIQYATFSTLYIFHVWFAIGLLAATANLVLNHANEKAH